MVKEEGKNNSKDALTLRCGELRKNLNFYTDNDEECHKDSIEKRTRLLLSMFFVISQPFLITVVV